MIKINGELLDVEEIALTEYLEKNGYLAVRIAVECNEMIIPKAAYKETILHSGDVVEIVSMVGGG